jgi:hypothetical protein
MHCAESYDIRPSAHLPLHAFDAPPRLLQKQTQDLAGRCEVAAGQALDAESMTQWRTEQTSSHYGWFHGVQMMAATLVVPPPVVVDPYSMYEGNEVRLARQ